MEQARARGTPRGGIAALMQIARAIAPWRGRNHVAGDIKEMRYGNHRRTIRTFDALAGQRLHRVCRRAALTRCRPVCAVPPLRPPRNAMPVHLRGNRALHACPAMRKLLSDPWMDSTPRYRQGRSWEFMDLAQPGDDVRDRHRRRRLTPFAGHQSTEPRTYGIMLVNEARGREISARSPAGETKEALTACEGDRLAGRGAETRSTSSSPACRARAFMCADRGNAHAETVMPHRGGHHCPARTGR